MPQATFIIPSPHEATLATIMASAGFSNGDGSGYWIEQNSEAPRPGSVLVTISTTDAKLTALAATLTQYVYKNDVTDAGPVVAARTPALTAPNLATLKTTLTNLISADVGSYATDSISTWAQMSGKLNDVTNRPLWKVGLSVLIGEVYQYPADKNLYQVIQTHKTQSDWTPPVSKSLYKRFYEPTGTTQPWVQPTGAHDAYPVGAKVTDGGYTWQSTIPANVWKPGVTGWTNLTPPPVTSDWSGAGVAYKVNDLVIYVPNGFTYKCLQAHTSQAGWTPVAVPALWAKQ